MKNKSLLYQTVTKVIPVVLLVIGMTQTGYVREIRSIKTYKFSDLSLITKIAISHDDRLMFIGGRKDVPFTSDRKCYGYIFSLQTEQIITTFLQHTNSITGACFSPDDKKIVTTGYPYTLWYWNTNTGEVLQTFTTRAKPSAYTYGAIFGIDFFADGIRMIAGDDCGNIHIWNLNTGAELMWSNPMYTGGGLTQIQKLDLFQNDEKVMVYGGTSPVEIRSTRSGTYLYWIGANAIVIDPNEKFFIGTIANFFQRYDINTGEVIEKISTFDSSKKRGSKNVFSPNGEFLVNDNLYPIEGDSPYPTITDVQSGQIIGNLTAEKSDQIIKPDYIEFSPSGKYLMISKENSISIFSMSDLHAGVKENY